LRCCVRRYSAPPRSRGIPAGAGGTASSLPSRPATAVSSDRAEAYGQPNPNPKLPQGRASTSQAAARAAAVAAAPPSRLRSAVVTGRADAVASTVAKARHVGALARPAPAPRLSLLESRKPRPTSALGLATSALGPGSRAAACAGAPQLAKAGSNGKALERQVQVPASVKVQSGPVPLAIHPITCDPCMWP
jgi:hypothetical protein